MKRKTFVVYFTLAVLTLIPGTAAATNALDGWAEDIQKSLEKGYIPVYCWDPVEQIGHNAFQAPAGWGEWLVNNFTGYVRDLHFVIDVVPETQKAEPWSAHYTSGTFLGWATGKTHLQISTIHGDNTSIPLGDSGKIALQPGEHGLQYTMTYNYKNADGKVKSVPITYDIGVKIKEVEENVWLYPWKSVKAKAYRVYFVVRSLKVS